MMVAFGHLPRGLLRGAEVAPSASVVLADVRATHTHENGPAIETVQGRGAYLVDGGEFISSVRTEASLAPLGAAAHADGHGGGARLRVCGLWRPGAGVVSHMPLLP